MHADWILTGITPGSLVAGYRVESRIGVGGMAVVFRARDEALGRMVALKILAPALAGDDQFRERFIRESRAAAAVDHPNIIPVYAAGEDADVLYIATRFVSGGDLRSVVNREGPLPGERAAFLLSPIASALDAAHSARLVHRDVKPANILVDTSPGRPDHPYLADFGLAKNAASSPGLTGTGQFLGTPDFSAPEQISGKPARPQTDQYALACVAFTVLTGSMPFARDESMGVLWAHMYDQPPPVTARRPDLPAAIDRVLARALTKAPEDRYATCGEFADALRAAVGVASYSASDAARSGSVTSDGSTGLRTPVGFAALPARTPTVTPHPSFPPTPTAFELSRWGEAPSVSTDMTASQPWPTGTSVHNSSAAYPATAYSGDPGSPPTTAAMLAQDPTEGRVSRQRHAAGPAIWHRGPWIARAAAVAVVLAGGAAAGAALLSSSAGHLKLSASGHSSFPASPGTTSLGSSPPGHGIRVKKIATLTDPGSRGVAAMAFGPNGTIVTVDLNDNAYTFDIATQTQTASVNLGSTGPTGTFFSPDGQTLADPTNACLSGDSPCEYVTYDTATLHKGLTLPKSSAESLMGGIQAEVDAESDGTEVVDTSSGTVLATLTDPDHRYIVETALTPDGKTLAVSSDSQGSSHTIYVWDVASQTIIATLTVPTEFGMGDNPMALTPDGKTLFISDGLTTYVYDVATQRRIATPPVNLGALSPDGKLLAGLDYNNDIALWNVSTGKLVATLAHLAQGVDLNAITFDADGGRLAASDSAGHTDVWDITGA